MIEIENLDKSFVDKVVLKDLNLVIPDGTIFGLVGINGSGKSTLLRTMSGIYKADRGFIKYDGKDVYDNEEVKKDIFFLPDEPFYDRNSKPNNIIDLYKQFYKLDETIYYEFLNKFKIPLDKSMHNFSKGMKRQVFIALAFAIKPKYLFLDEAFDGLDPLARLELKRRMMKIQEENNMTVIISSHSLRELEDICDSYGIIDHNSISSSGDINSSLQKYHKYQIAFKEIPSEQEFKDVRFISFKQDKRMISVVSEWNLEEMTKYMEMHGAVIIDEVNIDFEELFVIEVEARGYLDHE